MFYDEHTNKKITGDYILINNKYEKSYINILYKLKHIIIIENTEALKWESICVDFEYTLIKVITLVFKKNRVVGCAFHYIKSIRLKALKLGLYSNINRSITNKMIKELGSTPFLFNINHQIIEDIFTLYE